MGRACRTTGRGFLVADFETSTEKWLDHDKRARVWLWGLIAPTFPPIQFTYGTTLDEFMEHVLKENANHDNPIIYFHNLKFDGSYILVWLFEHGYTFDEELTKPKTFRASITDMNVWYFIEVRDKNKRRIVRFQDSLKKIPLPVADIPKTFGFKSSKGECDYDKYRPVGYQPTREEIKYVFYDVYIVACALGALYNEGFTAMTLSSDSFQHWKQTLLSERQRAKNINPKWAYRDVCPVLPLEVDDFVRRAYRGGYVYVNPMYAGKTLDRVNVYDINSMYPSKMRNRYLPMGQPIHFTGDPHPTKYQCYIVKVQIQFKIKPDHLPSIQLKHSYFFNPTQYVLSSDGNTIETVLTNVDLKLIYSQYDVLKIKYIEGYYFRKSYGLFTKFIDEQMAIKAASTGGKRFIAKRRMNSCYGKMGTAPRRWRKIPYLKDGILRFNTTEDYEESDPEYTAMAVFTTAWARYDIIRDAQRNYARFVYCDTDSLHLLDTGEEPDLPIHPTKIGYYKLEETTEKALYLRSKTYIHGDAKGNVTVKCAGAPQRVQAQMNFENFQFGQIFEGKLLPMQVPGGVVLHETTYRLKEA